MEYSKLKKNLDLLRKMDNMIFETDSFICDKCGTRMILKVHGDSTPCKAQGCDGIMYRIK